MKEPVIHLASEPSRIAMLMEDQGHGIASLTIPILLKIFVTLIRNFRSAIKKKVAYKKSSYIWFVKLIILKGNFVLSVQNERDARYSCRHLKERTCDHIPRWSSLLFWIAIINVHYNPHPERQNHDRVMNLVRWYTYKETVRLHEPGSIKNHSFIHVVQSTWGIYGNHASYTMRIPR
jgi:hypothetical protein